MKALVCHTLGSFDQLAVVDTEPPTLSAGQVRIDVKAASINFMDALKVQGQYQVKPEMPFILGDELAGIISEVAPDVVGVKVGARVAAQASGAFAEEAVVGVGHLIPISDDMSFVDASAFFVIYGTALRALLTRAQLKSKEVLLVLGGAGGVGLAAIALGKLMGARVIAVASTEAKRTSCLAAGAAHAIDYEGLRQQCDELTNRHGIDVVFDAVGGNFTEVALRSTGWQGRMVIIGFASGTVPRIPMNLTLLKERSIHGVYLGGSLERDPSSNAENYALLKSWYSERGLRPIISAKMALGEVPAALAKLANRASIGKMVVLPEE